MFYVVLLRLLSDISYYNVYTKWRLARYPVSQNTMYHLPQASHSPEEDHYYQYMEIVECQEMLNELPLMF